MTLIDAIERIRRVYKRKQTHAAAPEVIAQALGYTTLNGAFKGVIAALKQYGLLEASGNGLHVSDQSVSILELPDSDPERRRVISAIILNPAVCAELHRGFGDEQLPNAKLVLVKRGFTPKAANEIVRIYRSNLQFVNGDAQADAPVNDSKGVTSESSGPLRAPEPQGYVFETRREMAGSDQTLLFRIAESTEARIQLRGVVTQQAIGKLIALLELSADSFPPSRTATA